MPAKSRIHRIDPPGSIRLWNVRELLFRNQEAKMLLKSCYGMWRNCLQKPAWKNASSMKKVPIPSLIFISNNNRLIYSLNRDKLFQLDKSLT